MHGFMVIVKVTEHEATEAQLFRLTETVAAWVPTVALLLVYNEISPVLESIVSSVAVSATAAEFLTLLIE